VKTLGIAGKQRKISATLATAQRRNDGVFLAKPAMKQRRSGCLRSVTAPLRSSA
jgi:hypothetical protein